MSEIEEYGSLIYYEIDEKFQQQSSVKQVKTPKIEETSEVKNIS